MTYLNLVVEPKAEVLLVLVLIIRSKMSKKATPANNTKNSTSEESNSAAAPNKSTPTKASSSQLSRDDMINARLARFKMGMSLSITTDESSWRFHMPI